MSRLFHPSQNSHQCSPNLHLRRTVLFFPLERMADEEFFPPLVERCLDFSSAPLDLDFSSVPLDDLARALFSSLLRLKKQGSYHSCHDF